MDERTLRVPPGHPLTDAEIRMLLDRAGSAKLAGNARLELVFKDGVITKNLLTVHDDTRDGGLVGGALRPKEF